ncbi:hypothetical protein Taro_038310 [Colocasia esculenta]|uniref:Uncharacterized protein n=1 Tax=Colocasia esculenta TaxID=4460 RepID=A0A843W337_COLES|nr:hypothetical protein [Colocasia esculenta]
MTGHVATEVPVVTVIPVATAWCVAFLSRPVNGRLPPVRVASGSEQPVKLSRRPGWARSGRSLGGRRDKGCIATPRPVAFWGLKAKSLGRLPLSLFLVFLPSLLLSKEGKVFLFLLRRRGARWRRRWLVADLER